MGVLEDMKEKAESQLAELRKAEEAAKHNYEMLKQSLEAQISADKKDMKEEKAGKAEAEEAKAEAEGDLEVTTKELANAQETLATSRSTCMKVGADHEMSQSKGRGTQGDCRSQKDLGGDHIRWSGPDVLSV